MDPNLFRIDWQQTSEVLICIVVLAFIVERALALTFESKIYINVLGDWRMLTTRLRPHLPKGRASTAASPSTKRLTFISP